MWVEMSNPCDEADIEFFYASTAITVDGKKASCWDSPWVQGRKPRKIVPLIYAASMRKKTEGKRNYK